MVSEVNQKNIHAGGDVVGGNKTTHIHQQLSSFGKLCANLRRELIAGDKTEDNHCILDHYRENVDSEIIGLEEKLRKGKINENRIKKAMRVKEVFSKVLARRKFYKAGQHVYSELMNQMFLQFKARAVPLINTDASESDVESETALIINEMLIQIGDNLDLINSQQIEGILYYLTGNCHIQWHKG